MRWERAISRHPPVVKHGEVLAGEPVLLGGRVLVGETGQPGVGPRRRLHQAAVAPDRGEPRGAPRPRRRRGPRRVQGAPRPARVQLLEGGRLQGGGQLALLLFHLRTQQSVPRRSPTQNCRPHLGHRRRSQFWVLEGLLGLRLGLVDDEEHHQGEEAAEGGRDPHPRHRVVGPVEVRPHRLPRTEGGRGRRQGGRRGGRHRSGLVGARRHHGFSGPLKKVGLLADLFISVLIYCCFCLYVVSMQLFLFIANNKILEIILIEMCSIFRKNLLYRNPYKFKAL